MFLLVLIIQKQKKSYLFVVGFKPATTVITRKHSYTLSYRLTSKEHPLEHLTLIFELLHFKMRLWPLWDSIHQPCDSHSVVLGTEPPVSCQNTSPCGFSSLFSDSVHANQEHAPKNRDKHFTILLCIFLSTKKEKKKISKIL